MSLKAHLSSESEVDASNDGSTRRSTRRSRVLAEDKGNGHPQRSSSVKSAKSRNMDVEVLISSPVVKRIHREGAQTSTKDQERPPPPPQETNKRKSRKKAVQSKSQETSIASGDDRVISKSEPQRTKAAKTHVDDNTIKSSPQLESSHTKLKARDPNTNSAPVPPRFAAEKNETTPQNTPKLRRTSRKKRQKQNISKFVLTTNTTEPPVPHITSKRFNLNYYLYQQIPYHLQDNHDIHSGYRAYYSLRDCAVSLFDVHNESGNIWSHLLGFCFFFSLIYAGGLDYLPKETLAFDRLVLTVYLSSVAQCLLCSTLFHTFNCHKDSRSYDRLAILDYSGISFLVFGSFTALVHFGLYCHTMLRPLYLFITFVVSAAGLVLPWFPFFREPKLRAVRATFFFSLVTTLFTLVSHTAYLVGKEHLVEVLDDGIWPLGVAGWYLLGVVIYVRRYPESYFPGKMDIVINSHQIWHCCVILAAYSLWRFLYEVAEFRASTDTCKRETAVSIPMDEWVNENLAWAGIDLS